MTNNKKLIIEKKLGIPPDYQYKALRESNYIQSNWHQNKLEVIRKMVKLSEKDTVLDVGPGSGNFEFEFANKVKKITAIDYNDQAIDFLKKKLQELKISNVTARVADVKNSKWSNRIGTFNKIIMVDVIEHLSERQAKKLMKDFYKLLNKGGQVCIITPNFSSFWITIEYILDKSGIVPELGGKQHLSKFNSQTLRKILETNKFTTNKVATFNTLGYLVPNKKASVILNNIELLNPIHFGNMLVITATKL